MPKNCDLYLECRINPDCVKQLYEEFWTIEDYQDIEPVAFILKEEVQPDQKAKTEPQNVKAQETAEDKRGEASDSESGLLERQQITEIETTK